MKTFRVNTYIYIISISIYLYIYMLLFDGLNPPKTRHQHPDWVTSSAPVTVVDPSRYGLADHGVGPIIIAKLRLGLEVD
jgi:hypothetical protein